MLREAYDDVQILGFYDSPEDYVAGNLQSSKFESVEEETPFAGDMNIQYNQDMDLEDNMNLEDIPEDEGDSGISQDDISVEKLQISNKLGDKNSRASSRLS